MIKRSGFVILLAFAAVACGQSGDEQALPPKESPVEVSDRCNVIANNAFFYYADLEEAWRFYGETLGFETVADYGFAKIMRIAQTSYLTLVDADSGMHSADQPKTVALALITDELSQWYDYLIDEKVTMRSSGFEEKPGGPHDGFVAVDPEGYLLEFERFNVHPENERLMPVLDGLEAFFPPAGARTSRPAELGVKATVLWLYTPDVEAMREFYDQVMGFEMLVDQGWAKIHASSTSGFIGPVDGARGMHSWTEHKAVMLSFLTTDIETCFEVLRQQPDFELRSEEIGVESRAGARVFVGKDPDGYFIELDEFFAAEGNEVLLRTLQAGDDELSGPAERSNN